jgi:drug/metabolite transporter (DMT)-like permease
MKAHHMALGALAGAALYALMYYEGQQKTPPGLPVIGLIPLVLAGAAVGRFV